MTEEIIPDVQPAPEEIQVETPESVAEEDKVNYSDKTVAELASIFEAFASREDRLNCPKEAEAIKTAFYRRLLKEKARLDEDAQEAMSILEAGFKAYYEAYRKERAQYNAAIEKERGENLEKKEAIIAELKALIEKQDDVKVAFPVFREIQDKWRNTGSVPAPRARDINENYQHLVEMFYDQVEIDRELRDLDFKKNYEIKLKLCEAAEALAGETNVLEAFNELQTLHERWKELGPVEKQYRESIWERFRTATSVVNKQYQAHFETIKAQQLQNLADKTALCEKAEAILERELTDLRGWGAAIKEMTALQQDWRKLGFATKKENQKIYERFHAAVTTFFDRRKEFYSVHNDSVKEAIEKKVALCEAAEALKTSTDWGAATSKFIKMQKEWKEIGGMIPHNKAEQLWKRFRGACNEFFTARDSREKEPRHSKSPRNDKDRLVAKYHQLEQDIVTYENNIGFFTSSKNSEPLIRQMQERIEKAKAELAELGKKIRSMENAE